MKTMSEDAIAAILEARRPEYGDNRALAMWLSIVVSFGVRLHPIKTDERIAWAAACGWEVHPPTAIGPVPLAEALMQTQLEFGGSGGPPEVIGR